MTELVSPEQYVIEPETLVEWIASEVDKDRLLIVDLGQAQLYDRLHIPGAVHLPFGALTSGIKPATGKLPPLAQLAEVLASIGYSSDKEIIAYDDEGGGWAGRFIWILDLLGHRRAAYLNGGIHYWLHKKLPVEKGREAKAQASRQAGAVVPELSLARPEVSVTKEDILERLGSDSTMIWDTRSPEEFSGHRCFAQRGGHIPGAVNYEWTQAMDRQNGLRLRPLEEVRAELAALGLTEEKEIITHCQTHHRSGFSYLLGKILGFQQIKAYPGSWSEWGNDLEVPIESAD